MNEYTPNVGAAAGAFIAGRRLPFEPRIVFNAVDDLGGRGTGGASDDAAKAAADEAAASEAAKKAAEAAAEAAAREAAKKTDDDKSKDDKSKESAELLREVMDKKAKLREAEAARDALQNELNKFKDINLDEVKELLKQKSDREKQEAEAKGEFERVKQMMAEEHAKELQALKAQIDELSEKTKSKDSLIDTLTIGSAFSGSQFITSELTLSPTKARALYGSHFEIVNGAVVGYDKPAGSENRTPLVDSAGKNLSFEEAFKKIIDADPERDTLYRAKIQPGAQSKTQDLKAENKSKDTGLYGVKRIAASLK